MTLVSLVGMGFVLFSQATGLAQNSVKPPESPLTLDQAVDFALANYPAVRASMERALASKEGINLSRTAYLPRTDLLWQSNRATRNNIFGLLLPQSVVPPISGPVLPGTSDRGVWGSAAGILVSWEPFDFGYRGANVGVAKAAQGRANAELSLTKLDVAAAVGMPSYGSQRHNNKSRLQRRTSTEGRCSPLRSMRSLRKSCGRAPIALVPTRSLQRPGSN